MIVWPLLMQALVAGLPGHLDGNGIVYDGAADSDDATAWYVTVGHVEGTDGAGDFHLPRAGDGFFTAENGSVHSEVIVKNLDGDLSGSRATAFAVVAAWQAWLLTDETLGGVLPQSTALELDVQVVPQQSGSLTEQRLIVSCNYVTYA